MNRSEYDDIVLRKRYWRYLKKLVKNSPMELPKDVAETLSKKHLVNRGIIDYDHGHAIKNNVCSVNEYTEEYVEYIKHKNARLFWIDFRSWLAIGLSSVSIAATVIISLCKL